MKYLFSSICIFLFFIFQTAECFADVATPERIRRSNEVREWNKRFPNLKPELNVSLDQKNKNLVIETIFKSPAKYTIIFDEGYTIENRIHALSGDKKKVQIPLKPGNNTTSLVILSFTLYGVENSEVGPRLINKSIFAKIIKKFSIKWNGDNVSLQEERLSTPEYHMLQREYIL